MHAQNSSKGINLKPIYNLELYISIFVKKKIENLLEPKRMQLFALKLQYRNVLSDFFKKKSVEPYEFWLKNIEKTSSNICLSLSKYTFICDPF